MTANVAVRGLVKRFGTAAAVDGVDFDVQAGHFFTLLGPSGCGKTTTLRMIAGLEKPDAGEIRVGDRVVSAPERRIFVPPVRVVLITDDKGGGPFGAKSVGELTNPAVGGAIANAIDDAVGARVLSLPLTAEKVRAALLAK